MFPKRYFNKSMFTGSYFAPQDGGPTPPAEESDILFPIMLYVTNRMGMK